MPLINKRFLFQVCGIWLCITDFVLGIILLIFIKLQSLLYFSKELGRRSRTGAFIYTIKPLPLKPLRLRPYTNYYIIPCVNLCNGYFQGCDQPLIKRGGYIDLTSKLGAPTHPHYDGILLNVDLTLPPLCFSFFIPFLTFH